MRKRPEHKHLRYVLFRIYVIFIFRLYFPRLFVSGREYVPDEGNPNVMVGCHQNPFIDPLAPSLVLGTDRRTRGLMRSDIFSVPIISWFLRKLGIMPIARMDFEGPEAMEKFNHESLTAAADAIAEGHTLILFPEAGHQQGRYLGHFTQSYIRLAFDAAKRHGFKREVYITPYAHHYANYHHPFYDMMVMFGKPIPLSPYYKDYADHPRPIRRQITEEVEAQIRNLMLDISDLPHYNAIDYLRESRFGKDYCKNNGGDPNHLPDKLASDKKLVAAIEQNKEQDASLLDEMNAFAAKVKKAKLRDWLFDTRRRGWKLAFGLLLAIILLPLAAVSLALTFPVFLLPYIIKNRPVNGAYDPMFSSTCDVVGTIIFTFPIVCVLPAIVLMLCISWWFVFYPIVSLLMVLFYCRYQRLCVKVLGLLRFCVTKRHLAQALAKERKTLFDRFRFLGL